MARADKGMGGGVAGGRAGPNGHQAPGQPDGKLTENDLADELMGEFGQQGPSEELLSNTRETQAGPQPEPDETVLESFQREEEETGVSLGKTPNPNETLDQNRKS